MGVSEEALRWHHLGHSHLLQVMSTEYETSLK